MLVGITVSVFTQVIFTLTGLALLLLLSGRTELTRPVLVASAMGVLAVGGFYYFQRKGALSAQCGHHVAYQEITAVERLDQRC